jgi:hypothetical protein
MIFCKELFNYQDKLYYIYRKIRDGSVKPEFINDLKEYWNCTTVIKQTYRQTNEIYLLFLVEIEDAIIVND